MDESPLKDLVIRSSKGGSRIAVVPNHERSKTDQSLDQIRTDTSEGTPDLEGGSVLTPD